MTNEEAVEIAYAWVQNAMADQDPTIAKEKKKPLKVSESETEAIMMSVCALHSIDSMPKWIPVTKDYPKDPGVYYVTEIVHLGDLVKRVVVLRRFSKTKSGGVFSDGNKAVAWLSNIKPYYEEV